MAAKYWMLAALAGAASALGGDAFAADKGVHYGKTPVWVLPPPAPTDGATPPGAAVRVIYSDVQTRVTDRGDEIYTAWRIRLLTADALPIGNIGTSWNPAAGDVTVHQLRIIRGGETIDVLKKTRFSTIQREADLESSMLSGQLTATLQTPGLQVGDELEYAVTVRGQDPTLGDHHFGLSMLPPVTGPGAYRLRLSWPTVRSVKWQASPDMGAIIATAQGDQTAIDFALRDPKSAILTEGAPGRYNIRRLIEYSDYPGWEGISDRVWTLFDAAAVLKPGSAIRTEAAKIAAVSADPVLRAEAALRLVQDQIRYVYVGLNGGNYKPASADESWARRFGDCKAKTVLLLALLKELGITAEPVLVNSQGGDGLDERLPSPVLFDHVLVRATVAGKPVWLDGTRLGDRKLAQLPPSPYRWVLPVRQGGAKLEGVPAVAPRAPQLIAVLDIDDTAGIGKPAKVSVRHILRGDETYATRTTLAGMAAEDAERAVATYWRQQEAWVDADTVSWRYDEARGALILSLTGTGKPDWEGSDQDGWSHYLHGAGFYAPDIRKRPKEQDQAAPWAIPFPRFRCYATILRLPRSNGAWHWNINGKRMNRTLGGVAYWRGLALADNVVRSVMSSRSLTPEISAAEAKFTNDAVAGFDNDQTRIDQDFALKADVGRVEPMLAGGDAIDWLAEDTPCDGPKGKDGAPPAS